MSLDWNHLVWLSAAMIASIAAWRSGGPAVHRWLAALTFGLGLLDIVARLLDIGSIPWAPTVAALILALSCLRLTISAAKDSISQGAKSKDGAEPSMAATSALKALESSPHAAALATAEGSLIWTNEAWQILHGSALTEPWQTLLPTPESEARWQTLHEGAEAQGAAGSLIERKGPRDSIWTARAELVKVEQHDDPDLWWLTLVQVAPEEVDFRQVARKIGHDLNNLLSAIVGNVGLVMDAPDLSPEVERDLGEAETASMRAAEIIQRLQSMSRGDS